MKVRLPRRFRRLALFAMIAAGSFGAAAVAPAGEFDCGSDILPVTEACEMAADANGSRASEEWCGWGTHDSAPILRRTSTGFDQSLATFAAAATASTGLSLEQIVEPFAMVGTYRSDSVDQLQNFRKWWDFAALRQKANELVESHCRPMVNDAEQRLSRLPLVTHRLGGVSIRPFLPMTPLVPFVDFPSAEAAGFVGAGMSESDSECQQALAAKEEAIQWKLVELACEEPIDVTSARQAEAFALDEIARRRAVDVLAQASEPTKSGRLDVAAGQPDLASNPKLASKGRVRVGAAPIIATLEEPYLPYDLSQRDLRLWFPIALTTRPFCLRSQLTLDQNDPLWPEAEFVGPPRPAAGTLARQASFADKEPADPKDAVTEGLLAATVSLQASADCLLDEWVWQVERTLDEGSTLRQALSLETTGARIALAFAKTDRVTAPVTDLLARVWSEAPAKPAARQLLARAEAFEQPVLAGPLPAEQEVQLNPASPQLAPSPVSAVGTAEQIASAAETLRQWIQNAQLLRRDWLRIADAQPSGELSR